MSAETMGYRVKLLAWQDEPLGDSGFGEHIVPLVASFGSGLARRAADEASVVWAISDRGPNIKPKIMVKRYGVEALRPLQSLPGAKIMPRLDIGPRFAKLRVGDDRVELVEERRIVSVTGQPVAGIPPASSAHTEAEPVFDLAGHPLPPDPEGMDTEGIAALSCGEFWVAEEFGPSLVRLDASGRIIGRYVPAGTSGADTTATHPVLPAIAGKRQLNRGFEGIAISPDETALFVAFQGPLAHPDRAAHEAGRHVRIWRLDPVTAAVTAQYLYPFDDPASFRRDGLAGRVVWSDLKVSELVALSHAELLVLERGSQTTKIYRVKLSNDRALAPTHLDAETRPTIEQLSAAGAPLPELAKELVLSSDDALELAADLEGMAVLSASELLLVSDNDFGVEGARTSFAKVIFDAPVFGVTGIG